MSSDREQLKHIVRDLLSEKIGKVGFQLGQRAQENQFMTFYELYGQEPAQWLFFRVPKSLTTFGGAITAMFLADVKPGKIAQYLGVGSGDLAADFSKILADINKKGTKGFLEIFPSVAEHFSEVSEFHSGFRAYNVSALKKSLSSDLDRVASKLNDISRSSDLQEMVTKYGSFIGVDVDISKISDFLAKHSAEVTGDLAALENALRSQEIPEWIDGMFGEWQQGFSALTDELGKDFPEQKAQLLELFDNVREKLSL